MGEDDFARRLAAFENRIRQSEHGPSRAGAARGKFAQGSLAWRMVTELVTGMLLGLVIGYGLDSVAGTKPWFLMLFAILGFAAGVRTMMRTADEVRRKRAEGALISPGQTTTGPHGPQEDDDGHGQRHGPR